MCDGVNSIGVSDESVKFIPEVGEFYNCPIHCIPESVYSFLRTYDVLEKYPASAPNSIEDFNPRYLEALREYESNMKKMTAPKEVKKKDVHKSNISKMKSLMK
jgi:hypothetical protein